jgi:hypothetical protein
MTLTRSSFKATIFLTLLSILVVHALAQGGAVPGTAQKPVAAAPADNTPITTPATGDSKPLPWKFLAKPMGALDSNHWSPILKSFDRDAASKWSLSDEKNLNDLFEATIGTMPKSKPVYLVLHVVEYPDSVATKPKSDHWYLYHRSEKHYGDPHWSYAKFTGQRIYGASPVYFLFLHLNAGVITLQNATQQVREILRLANTPEKNSDDKAIRSNLKATGIADLPVKLREKLLALTDNEIAGGITLNNLPIQTKEDDPKSVAELRFCEAARLQDQFDWSSGQGGISSGYKRIRYEAAVVKRTPANVENLKTILGLILGGVAHAATSCLGLTDHDILWGAGRIDNIGLPSDITIAGYLLEPDADVDSPVQEADRARLQIGSTGSYNDEQLYWWDASIGIPVHKIKDLQYSDSDNTVTATQVDKQSAYAMFNIMLHPVDLSSPGDNVWPRILVGFPLASSPWDKLFAGGAIGLPFKPFKNFQFFAGATFLRTTHPATLVAGQTATNSQLQNDLRIKTTPRLTFGINVPVKSVIDKLKK